MTEPKEPSLRQLIAQWRAEATDVNRADAARATSERYATELEAVLWTTSFDQPGFARCPECGNLAMNPLPSCSTCGTAAERSSQNWALSDLD
jgi:hypothetical protein